MSWNLRKPRLATTAESEAASNVEVGFVKAVDRKTGREYLEEVVTGLVPRVSKRNGRLRPTAG